MKRKICFVLDWYPTETNNGCIFAKHLICAIADMGYDCTVIAPRIFCRNTFKKDNRVPFLRNEKTELGNTIKIFSPVYIHCSSRKSMMKLSMDNHYRCVLKTIKKYDLSPDVIYGHFLYQCGLTAARVGDTLGIPAYCACGENSLRLEEGKKPYATGLMHGNWKTIIQKLSGIICVSSNNKNLLLDSGFVESTMKMDVFPNGFDERVFYQMEKSACREALSLPKDAFIVAYTGAFSSNKGADRLNEALKDCPDVYALFMGQGMIELDDEKILWKGRVPNNQVAQYLNAADVFVLPTRGEGCSNAIVEALACGLPVISSDLPFNDDILNADNSLRINVESVEQIKSAIENLRKNENLRSRLAMGALISAEKLSIEERARRILRFMEL